MRDINRIDPIMEELRRFWKANQDLRFGQLIYIIENKFYSTGKNIFSSEDDVWLDVIKILNEKEDK